MVTSELRCCLHQSHLDHLDFPQPQGRVFADVMAAKAGPEETDHTALFLLPGGGTVLPGVTKVEQSIEIDLVDILEALDSAPDEELLVEDGFQLVEGGFGHIAAHCVCKVGFDGRFDRDARPLRCGRQDFSGGLWLDGGRREGEDWCHRREFSGRHGWGSRPELFLREAKAEFFRFFPDMGLGAPAKERAVERSPDPLGTAAAPPGFVAGVFALWMVACVDRKHRYPDFSEILFESLNWGKKSELFQKRLYSDCTVLSSILVRSSNLLKLNKLSLVEAAGVEPASEIIDNKERLHAQSCSGSFALCAQNGQDAHIASPWISSL
jgi:hypothetical protein